MKKILIFILAAVLLLLPLVGCGKCKKGAGAEEGNGDGTVTESKNEKKEFDTVLYESEHYKIDKPMAVYMYNYLYNTYVEYYGSYAQYFIPSDVTTFIGADVILRRAEAATAAGITLTEAELIELDRRIEEIEKECKDSGKTLQEVYGISVEKPDIYEVLKLQALASKMYDGKKSEVKELIMKDTERIAEWIENHDTLEDYTTKNAGYILLKSGGSSESEMNALIAEAEAILVEYMSGEKTLAAFEALAKKYSDSDPDALYNIAKGEIAIEIETWIYESSRQPNDVAIIKGEDGYYIVYFIGNGLEKCDRDAVEELSAEDMADWDRELSGIHSVKINNDEIKNIFGEKE